MFVGLIRRSRFRNAVKKYARLLGPKLAHDYGSSAHYTPAQIETTVKKLNLPVRYLCLGQAVFLAEEEFGKIEADTSLGSYADLRRLFNLYKPSNPVSAEFGQAPASDYTSFGDTGPFGHT